MSAWLNTAPGESTKTRIEILDDKPEMPDCAALHIIEYLFEVGPTLASGMGNMPLTHCEINAWQNNKGILLNAWEAKMLRTLSIEYIHQTMLSKDIACKAPYGETIANQITAVSMRETIRGIAKL